MLFKITHKRLQIYFCFYLFENEMVPTVTCVVKLYCTYTICFSYFGGGDLQVDNSINLVTNKAFVIDVNTRNNITILCHRKSILSILIMDATKHSNKLNYMYNISKYFYQDNQSKEGERYTTRKVWVRHVYFTGIGISVCL